MIRPAVIVHADWGTDPRKRQMAVAKLAYAAAAEITSFTDFLGRFGSPPWEGIASVARCAAEISLPRQPGNGSRLAGEQLSPAAAPTRQAGKRLVLMWTQLVGAKAIGPDRRESRLPETGPR